MALSKETTSKIIKEFGANENDSGSARVQVAILTQQINDLTEHLKVHKHDSSSRRGLFLLVGKRRGLLDYIKAHDEKEYVELLEKLNIRK